MAYQRSEYEDKSLKKNAFSGRLLKLKLERLDSQRGQIEKHFRHEKDQLQRQLAEGEQIIKLKCLDPLDIRPLSSWDLKRLSPQFTRKLSTSPRSQGGGSAFPPLSTSPGSGSSVFTFTNSKQATTSAQTESQRGIRRRRSSLPPIVIVHECEAENGDVKRSDTNANLLHRRRSTNTIKLNTADDFTGRINEFLEKLKNENTNEIE